MKNIRVFLPEKFRFLEMKFSIYLNRRVFVMRHKNIVEGKGLKVSFTSAQSSPLLSIRFQLYYTVEPGTMKICSRYG